MFNFKFLYFILITLWFVQLDEMFGQEECIQLHTKTQVMGLKKRADVNLEDVQVQTLPIVFHVVHTGAGEPNNISDEQVLSQVDVLNESFADSKIQFCMASRTPSDQPTNGITRFDGNFWSEYEQDGIASPSAFIGGVDDSTLKETVGCWNPDQYINIYVVTEINGNNGQSGTQGYAYLGPTGDCRDGIVAIYNTVGNVGELKPGRDLGYTVVHEVGHHLSLYHTFQSQNGCEDWGTCFNSGDYVCDTPPGPSTTGCTNTCPGIDGSNYMDYSSQDCKVEFTVGQAERMHEMLQGGRQGLVDNLSCVPVVDFDVTTSAAYYQQEWCAPYQDIWIDVVNQGTQIVPFVNVEMFCNGPQEVISLYDLPVGTTPVFFEDVYVEGAEEFTVETISGLDQFSANDVWTLPLYMVDGDVLEIWVTPDVFGNETSWELRDGAGEIVVSDGGYGTNSDETFYYSPCIFDDCYVFEIEDTAGDGFCTVDFGSDGVCDIGSDGVLATVGLDTLVNTGFGLEFDVIQFEFCNSLSQCNMDYNGDGYIGNTDVLELLADMGCVGACYTDPNDDNVVNVQDLLLMLASTGPCPEE